MEYRSVPPSWQGGLPLDYSLGGSFDAEACPSGCVARVKVNNYEERVTASNVVGIIKGDVEPDR